MSLMKIQRLMKLRNPRVPTEVRLHQKRTMKILVTRTQVMMVRMEKNLAQKKMVQVQTPSQMIRKQVRMKRTPRMKLHLIQRKPAVAMKMTGLQDPVEIMKQVTQVTQVQTRLLQTLHSQLRTLQEPKQRNKRQKNNHNL